MHNALKKWKCSGIKVCPIERVQTSSFRLTVTLLGSRLEYKIVKLGGLVLWFRRRTHYLSTIMSTNPDKPLVRTLHLFHFIFFFFLLTGQSIPVKVIVGESLGYQITTDPEIAETSQVHNALNNNIDNGQWNI